MKSKKVDIINLEHNNLSHNCCHSTNKTSKIYFQLDYTVNGISRWIRVLEGPYNLVSLIMHSILRILPCFFVCSADD